jgi:Galactosyltransferase
MRPRDAHCKAQPPALTDHTPEHVLTPRDLYLLQMRRYSPHNPHHRGAAGGGGLTKPVATMNILLSVAIFLQMYQIFTSKEVTMMKSGFPTSGENNFPRGLRGHTGIGYPDFKDFLYNPNNDGGRDAEALSALPDRMNQWHDSVLYGIEEGTTSPPEELMPYLRRGYRDLDHDPSDGNATKPVEPPFQPSKYNYSLTPVRTPWNLPTTPKPAMKDNNICIVILSGRSNFERRRAIRETWGQNQTNIYFVIGGPEPDNQQDKDWEDPNSTSTRLWKEHERYGDLLDTIHPDTYKGLPYKLHYAIQWIANHDDLQHIQWILKADDDVVVRPNTLRYYVLRNFNPLAALVIGRIEPSSTPHRTGKWAEDPRWPEGENYPPWAYGSTGYVMSRAVFHYIAAQSSLYYYQGEDASLGIWLYESPLDVSWIDSPDFCIQASDAYYDHKYSAVIGHDVSPDDMRRLYDKWEDPKNIEEMIHTNHTNTKGHIFNLELQGRHAYSYKFQEFGDDQYGEYERYPWEESGQDEDLLEIPFGNDINSISDSLDANRIMR